MSSNQGHLSLNSAQLQRYYDHIRLPLAHRHTPGKTSREVAQGPDALPFLSALVLHTLTVIPFENLSLHYSVDHLVHTDAAIQYEKVMGPLDLDSARGTHVRNRRGGYCMNNNVLFHAILRSLGFTVFSTGGRVSLAMQPGAKAQDSHRYAGWNHMVNLVDIQGQRYLVDVGMGSTGPCRPVPLIESTDGHLGSNVAPQKLRLVKRAIPDCLDDRQRLWCYDIKHNDQADWLPAYCFAETAFIPEDFRVMNHYTSTSRTSFFTWTVLCVKFLVGRPGNQSGPETATQEAQERLLADGQDLELVGDLTMYGNRISVRIRGESHTVAVFENETQRVDGLEKWFGIWLTDAQKGGISTLR